MATYANINIDQGSDFELSITATGLAGTPIDLTNYTVRGQIRRNYASSTSVDFIFSIPSPTTGVILASLTNLVTAGMKAQRYVYDIEIVDSSNKVTRIAEGQAEVHPRVTRINV